MVDGEHRADGGIVSRRRGRHAAPAAGGGASAHGLRARDEALFSRMLAAVPRSLVAGFAWLFERRRHVLIVAATVVAVAVLGGAIAARSFAGAPQALDETADVVSTTRPTSTDPAAPTSYAPILPSPEPPRSVGGADPGSTREDIANPATEAPADSAAEPTAEPAPIAEPGRETAPPATNQTDATNPPDEAKAPEDPEDCVEQRGFLELLFLGPSCP